MPTKEPSSPIESMPYEQAVEELEALIAQLEQGAMGLEESLKAQQRGDALIKHCRKILDAAEQQIEHLADQDKD